MKTLLLDLDGTMYRGNQLIQGGDLFIKKLIELNVEFYFLTNNARRTKKENVQHMEKVGYSKIKNEHFYTSSMAAASYVAGISNKRRAFVVGENGLIEALKENGFEIVESNADFVFVGLDIHGGYELYSKALQNLLNGAELIGTNSDRLLAHGDSFNIGNGSIVAMFEYAIQKECIKVGKPNGIILNEMLKHIGKNKDEVMIVGDNLETDILLGINEGIESVLVTSGVHQDVDIAIKGIHPTRVIKDLMELL